ncbi:MAG: transcriptional regulator, MarR family [Microbacteriaceae bacterium]|nr:transcriptional regulator, MarR family [Microbacteriaceae bacterium]
MADASDNQHQTVGAWAKRYYFANRAMMESILRPYGLGSTQWFVLYELVNTGPTMQRDLAQRLHLERATLSGVVATLVRKGLVAQATGADQRQRQLTITDSGLALWKSLPDPVEVTKAIALEGADPAEVEIAIRVLRSAAERVEGNVAD